MTQYLADYVQYWRHNSTPTIFASRQIGELTQKELNFLVYVCGQKMPFCQLDPKGIDPKFDGEKGIVLRELKNVISGSERFEMNRLLIEGKKSYLTELNLCEDTAGKIRSARLISRKRYIYCTRFSHNNLVSCFEISGISTSETEIAQAACFAVKELKKTDTCVDYFFGYRTVPDEQVILKTVEKFLSNEHFYRIDFSEKYKRFDKELSERIRTFERVNEETNNFLEQPADRDDIAIRFIRLARDFLIRKNTPPIRTELTNYKKITKPIVENLDEVKETIKDNPKKTADEPIHLSAASGKGNRQAVPSCIEGSEYPIDYNDEPANVNVVTAPTIEQKLDEVSEPFIALLQEMNKKLENFQTYRKPGETKIERWFRMYKEGKTFADIARNEYGLMDKKSIKNKASLIGKMIRNYENKQQK